MALRVLIVEDDDSLRQLLMTALGGLYDAEAVPDAETAIARATADRYDILVADVNLPRMSGIDLIPQLFTLNPQLVVLVISGEPTVDMAVEAMKRGAMDFLSKPFTLADLRSLVQLAAARVPASLRMGSSSVERHPIVADSPAMQQVLSQAGAIAPYNTSVLIIGETGTGKELVARLLHAGSPRAKRPFVALNCAAVPEQLLEDELFGHVKGAFTGAQEMRIGRFEQADGGTLFLDEIADMSLPLQAKLLRVLQEREFEKVGSGRTQKVDVRIIAATSVDLERDIHQGRFRPDLYYRLNVVRLNLPPLRERPEDVQPLATTLLMQFCVEAGLPQKTIDPEAATALQSYAWPGNTRQLRNAMERAAVMTGSAAVILKGDLPEEIRHARPFTRASTGMQAPMTRTDAGSDVDTVLRDVERKLLLESLQRAGGNKLLAAKLVGMKRTTFMARLKKALGE